jgi:hypothetical protein
MRLTLPENTTYNHSIRPFYRYPAFCERLTNYVATNELKQL